MDAANGELHLKNNNESVKQIVTADTVIITKTDIVDRDTLQRMRKRLGKLNPAAKILEAARGEIDPEAVLTNTQSRMEKIGTMERFEHAEDPAAVTAHDAGVRSMSIKFYAPLDWTAFGLWMSMLLYAHGEKIMRIKGIVDVGDRGPIVINGVQHIIHPPQHLEDWNGEERNSQIVFIMKEIEPEQLMASLVAFQNILGSAPEISEINYDPYSGER